MEEKLFKSLFISVIFLFLTSAGPLYSQTAGTLSFSVTTTSTGGYSPGHIIAIWIENNTTSFIKTKIRYSSVDNLDHLQTWVTKSGQNVVDATTGATLTTHGTITFLWNGTNVAGTLVPDGGYNIWLEMAWASSLTTGKTVNSFPFTKGTAAFHSAPANTANLLSMAIDWTPTVTSAEGILENKDIAVYPNPSSGLIHINFKNPQKETLAEFVSADGKLVYSKMLSNLPAGVKTFDLSGHPNGYYFCRLISAREEIVFGIVISK